MFSAILGGCTSSIVGNSGLVKKVWFPREILPLSVVGASLVHFFLQLLVLLGAELVIGHPFVGPNLIYVPLAFVTLIVIGSAIGIALAAANVYLRDIQHLLEVVLLLWFWMTPIVYPVGNVITKLSSHGVLLHLYLANPMNPVIVAFQKGLYKATYVNGNAVLFTGNVLGRLGLVFVGSLVALFFAQRLFHRLQGSFAQEL
jgi:ABC-2 type transport system permease protein